MALKIIKHPDGHEVKMGRKRASTPYTGKHLKDYFIHEKLPTPPDPPWNYGEKASKALAEMYGNDQLGDCVIAAVMHAEGVATANAGDEVTYAQDNVVSAYGWCGYNPSDPNSDEGCEIQPVLGNWISDGLPGGGSKAAGFLAVDPTNETNIKLAVWLFENLIFGIELPDAWVNPMPSVSGFTWDVAGDPDPNNGHCVAGFDCVNEGVSFATWAMTGTLTWAAIKQYCAASANGELYVVITQDVIDKASSKAPDGLDWATMVADFNAMGGSLTPPEPAPSPEPTPTPSPQPSPTPNPSPAPQPAPAPTPEPTPTPTPAPAPTPAPEPAPTPSPTPAPAPAPQPNPDPSPTPSASMIPLPDGAVGIVVERHGGHLHVIPLPENTVGIEIISDT